MIRQATAEEMLTLWGYDVKGEITPTARFFIENIVSGNAEFWTIDEDGELLGELYVFKKLEDIDFADGIKRVYLCAFRIKKELRGQGLGSQLMEHVLISLKEKGYQEVTIGVEECEEANVRLYNRFGFCEKIKDCFEDPCARDGEMRPEACESFRLLLRTL